MIIYVEDGISELRIVLIGHENQFGQINKLPRLSKRNKRKEFKKYKIYIKKYIYLFKPWKS